MPLTAWWDRAREVPGAPGVRRSQVEAAAWLAAAQDLASAGARLLALWVSRGGEARGSGQGAGAASAAASVHAAFLSARGVLILELPVVEAGEGAAYPGLEALFPAASRLQRCAYDLSGVRSSDPDDRPWLWHGAWPAGWHPLGAQPPDRQDAFAFAYAPEPYPFVRVEGEGVHEIPVGPVHAGTIEPGHFRFSVVGEKVLRLEEHLGYVHKGIERRFSELSLLEGQRLAARVSGDSAVAFSWAYAQALEGMSGCTIPPRAAWLRALYLELERIVNHLGDLGALGNDAGFAFGLAQFSRLKELLVRSIATAFGQRYLFDAIVPGGSAVDLAAEHGAQLLERLAYVAQQCAVLRGLYDEHAGLRDRFAGTGTLAPALAARLGVLGLAARASGQALDLRVDLPCVPYPQLEPVKCVRTEGDVAARVVLRFDEVEHSCRLIRDIVSRLPAGERCCELVPPPPGAFAVGLIEGWRGPVFIALEAARAGRIARCHPHDPSWQNWPALEHAVIGNIVPDFPLINKSFNLSYSGVDL